MKGVLLDTHLPLWAADGTLGESVRSRIRSELDFVFVSTVSLWEISIKMGLRRIELLESLDEFCDGLAASGYTTITIEQRDIVQYAELPFPVEGHRDPFDRMLVAQAATRGVTLLTSDRTLSGYGPMVEQI